MSKIFELEQDKYPDTFDFNNLKDSNLLGKKLLELRKRERLSLDALGERLEQYGVNIGRAGINKWELGISIPNAYQLLVLCDIFNINEPVSFFTGRERINSEGLKKVSVYMEDLISSGNYLPLSESSTQYTFNVKYIRMPVSLLSASAGTGDFLDNDSFELVSFPERSVPRGADFGVRVHGDSMEPVYNDGQIVWVKKCSQLRVGEVGLFVLDGNGYIKSYSEMQPENPEEYTDISGAVRAQPVLVSYNRNYSPIIVSPANSFSVCGRVL